MAGAVPLYGTTDGLTPSRELTSEQARCELEPTPAWPFAASSPCARSDSANSFTVLAGTCLPTIRTIGADATIPTGSKLLIECAWMLG